MAGGLALAGAQCCSICTRVCPTVEKRVGGRTGCLYFDSLWRVGRKIKPLHLNSEKDSCVYR